MQNEEEKIQIIVKEIPSFHITIEILQAKKSIENTPLK